MGFVYLAEPYKCSACGADIHPTERCDLAGEVVTCLQCHAQGQAPAPPPADPEPEPPAPPPEPSAPEIEIEEEPDSEPGRSCGVCGKDISHKPKRQSTCSRKCGQSLRQDQE